jgi:NhaP-type Na+/H+ or K+/H+ antiporter
MTPKQAGRPAFSRATTAVIGAALPIPFIRGWPVSQILGCVIGGVGIGIALTLLGGVGRKLTTLPPVRTMVGVAAGVLAGWVLSALIGFENVLASICWGFSLLALIALIRWGNRAAPGSGPVPWP